MHGRFRLVLKRRVIAAAVGRVHRLVGQRLGQQLGAVGALLALGVVDWRGSKTVLGRAVGAVRKQIRHNGGVALARRNVQRRALVVVWLVDVDAARHTHTHVRQVVALRRKEQLVRQLLGRQLDAIGEPLLD